MADRKTYPVMTPKSDVQILTAKFKGAGGADMTNQESANMGGGEIASAVRTGTGAFTLTLRKKYAELKFLECPHVWGTTDDLQCKVLTWDVVAGTATIKLEVGTVATDPATTDFVHFMWAVRNSGFNK